MIDNIVCARATMLLTKLVRNYPHYSNKKKVAVIYLPFYTLLICRAKPGWFLVFQDFSHRSKRPLSWVFSLHTQNLRLIINKVNYPKPWLIRFQ